jgi:extradiol dioxygenase family protein
MDIRPLRMALQVRDIEEARNFYREVLGCLPGRSDGSSIDFILYGHQITCHLNSRLGKQERNECIYRPTVRGVPNPYLGVGLTIVEWDAIVERLRKRSVKFVIEPHLACFEGAADEGASVYFLDPSGNGFEFKSIHTVVEPVWRENRRKATGAKTLWPILAAAVFCWILLQAKKSADEVYQRYFSGPPMPPACANSRACVP